MAGESPSLKQDDIEELLRQAQLAAGLVPDSGSPASTAASAAAPKLPPVAAAPAPQPVSAPVATAVAPPPPAAGRPGSSQVGDDIQYLLSQAEQAIASVDQPVDPAIANLSPFEFRDLAAAPASGEKATLELLKDVDLDLKIELGRTRMYLEDVLKLKRGSVVPLEKLAGDPVDVFVNGRMVARGEVLVLNDNFCVRVTELVAGSDAG
ncbi:MAG: flagellar motor switch protein FliN [Pirellulaceae bacterium]|nr:flagellar motor switch protein FliN [Pirellulaceae bacterium]